MKQQQTAIVKKILFETAHFYHFYRQWVHRGQFTGRQTPYAHAYHFYRPSLPLALVQVQAVVGHSQCECPHNSDGCD